VPSLTSRLTQTHTQTQTHTNTPKQNALDSSSGPKTEAVLCLVLHSYIFIILFNWVVRFQIHNVPRLELGVLSPCIYAILRVRRREKCTLEMFSCTYLMAISVHSNSCLYSYIGMSTSEMETKREDIPVPSRVQRFNDLSFLVNWSGMNYEQVLYLHCWLKGKGKWLWLSAISEANICKYIFNNRRKEREFFLPDVRVSKLLTSF